MIIEDHEDSRRWIELLVETAGYRAIPCATATEALTRLQGGERVGLILLDLMLPETSGFQFRAEQTADPELSRIPTVIMSGMDRPSRYEGNLHPTAYLQKPLNPDAVLALVHEHCAG